MEALCLEERATTSQFVCSVPLCTIFLGADKMKKHSPPVKSGPSTPALKAPQLGLPLLAAEPDRGTRIVRAHEYTRFSCASDAPFRAESPLSSLLFRPKGSAWIIGVRVLHGLRSRWIDSLNCSVVLHAGKVS